ncbi:MAG: YtxH domain-containing protein [Acidobacteria bacterium]|nr:YtxH domain-containing protein [Acidobacteriota bacterium]
MRNGNGTNFGYLVAGVLVGGTLTLLTTPYSGSRLRRKIRYTLEDRAEDLGRAVDELKNTCQESYHRAEKVLNNAGKKLDSMRH